MMPLIFENIHAFRYIRNATIAGLSRNATHIKIIALLESLVLIFIRCWPRGCTSEIKHASLRGCGGRRGQVMDGIGMVFL